MTKSAQAVTAAEKTELAVATSPTFKVVKHVTLPLIKLELDVPAFVRVDSEMFVGKEVKGTGDKAKMEPAILVHCTNLMTGEPAQMIINKVVEGNFKDSYPNGAYVGKSFQFIKHAKRDGKQYNDFSIAEIEVTE